MPTTITTTPRPLRIALLTDITLSGHRHFVTDFALWAREHAFWHILLQEGRENEQFLDPIALMADAAIVGGNHIEYLPKLRRHRIPFIVIDPLPNNWRKLSTLRHATIERLDSFKIGTMAAEYFLERRYTSFAFVAEPNNHYWTVERQQGFMARLKQDGYTCQLYNEFSDKDQSDWIHERPRLMAWLTALPKPTAVFAAMDGRARLVLDACAVCGIKVPNEIAVLGVDNDQVLCETAYPRLSSISITGRGQIVAARLDARLKKLPVERIDMPKETYAVVERESTGHNAMANPFLARGLLFIRKNAHTTNLRVDDVVTTMGCSRRLAEQLFMTHVGHTIKKEIEILRFREVKRLLKETNLSIAAIAETCAFKNESHLSRRFAQLFGMTMTTCRLHS